MRDMERITADELESLAQSLLKLPVGTSQDRLVRALDELRSMLAEDLRRAAATITALQNDLAAERAAHAETRKERDALNPGYWVAALEEVGRHYPEDLFRPTTHEEAEEAQKALTPVGLVLDRFGAEAIRTALRAVRTVHAELVLAAAEAAAKDGEDA